MNEREELEYNEERVKQEVEASHAEMSGVFKMTEMGYDVIVCDSFFHCTVKNVFVNETNDKQDGTVTFRLNSNCSITNVEIESTKKKYQVLIKEKKEAEQIFKEQKEQGKSTMLIENKNKTEYKFELGQIEQGEMITVSIEYIAFMGYNQRGFSFYLMTEKSNKQLPDNYAFHGIFKHKNNIEFVIFDGQQYNAVNGEVEIDEVKQVSQNDDKVLVEINPATLEVHKYIDMKDSIKEIPDYNNLTMIDIYQPELANDGDVILNIINNCDTQINKLKFNNWINYKLRFRNDNSTHDYIKNEEYDVNQIKCNDIESVIKSFADDMN